VVDHDDVLAQVLDQVKLVAGEQHRHALCRQLGEQPAERVDRQRVQPRERLVQHQQHRLADQRSRELDALLVAVRQPFQTVGAAAGQPEPGQPAIGGAPCRAPLQASELAQVHQLLAHAHARVQPGSSGI